LSVPDCFCDSRPEKPLHGADRKATSGRLPSAPVSAARTSAGVASRQAAGGLAREEIQDRAARAGQLVERADRAGVDIDAAGADEPRGDIAYAGLRHVEALGAGTDAAEHVSVPDGADARVR
jgi:hypothetical protein